ncbi:hypothetical protein LEM8419_01443 [Neolewinella maritima]|uniref:DUF3810 domain-containing protein n=1 Tax=Neolewinella maritima TaxID=1383882 RepID=A0ABN8F5R8_9BACT|nr:hypothetical protein LEM8419_01443 [Neolewinella maritima]
MLLTVLSVLLRVFLPPAVLETYYSRGVFVGVRAVLDYTVGFLPIPLFYVFWLGVSAWLVYQWRYFRGVRRLLSRLVVAVLSLILLFLWLWGYNYGRVPVEEQLGFGLYQPDVNELRGRVYAGAERLAGLRSNIASDTFALDLSVFPDDLEASVRPLVASALQRHGFNAPGRPRGWQLYPRGILLRLSTAGVYWPWAAQGNIDAGLHPLQRPAVLAHELSHAYGFGDEGSCSFWAYLAAAESDDPLLQYTLELAYWRTIAGLLRYAEPETYLKWRAESLDPGIRNDLQAIYDNGALYTDIAPVLRDATYTVYLKAQGIHEGLLNYGRVVQLVEGYRQRSVSDYDQ